MGIVQLQLSASPPPGAQRDLTPDTVALQPGVCAPGWVRRRRRPGTRNQPPGWLGSAGGGERARQKQRKTWGPACHGSRPLWLRCKVTTCNSDTARTVRPASHNGMGAKLKFAVGESELQGTSYCAESWCHTVPPSVRQSPSWRKNISATPGLFLLGAAPPPPALASNGATTVSAALCTATSTTYPNKLPFIVLTQYSSDRGAAGTGL